MQKTTTIYADMMDALQAGGIRYSLLRDRDLSAPDLEELDLLVWPQDRSKFAKVAHSQEFVLRNQGPGKAVYARFDRESGRLFLLDVHFALIQNGLEYLPLQGVAERLRQTPEGYPILSVEDELLHLFFHNLIGKQRLQEKHLPRVRSCLAAPPDEVFLNRRISSPEIREIFRQFCDAPEAFATDSALARQAARRIVQVLGKSGAVRSGGAFRKRKRGVHFAFLGVDGAGKSTTVEHVQKLLAAAGKIKYEFVYMGPWGYVRSPVLKKVYDWKLFPHKEDWAARIRQKLAGKKVPQSLPLLLIKWLSGTLKGWIYYAAVYFEMWYRYLKEVRPNLRKGRIVLSDRYVYDLRYIYKKRPIHPFRIWRWLVCRFFPAPDRAVLIWNTAEDIIARKPQLGAAEIELFQEYYRRALTGIPTLELRSDRPPEELARQIVAEIMQIYLPSPGGTDVSSR